MHEHGTAQDGDECADASRREGLVEQADAGQRDQGQSERFPESESDADGQTARGEGEQIVGEADKGQHGDVAYGGADEGAALGVFHHAGSGNLKDHGAE